MSNVNNHSRHKCDDSGMIVATLYFRQKSTSIVFLFATKICLIFICLNILLSIKI